MSELKLEAVYYSNPFPRSLEAMTVLGLVFDRIHLPYVSLPDDGFTLEEINDRQRGLMYSYDSGRTTGTQVVNMIQALQFTRWKEWTTEFIHYPHAGIDVARLTDGISPKLVREIYDLTCPPRENFEPMFANMHAFGLSKEGSGAGIYFAGDFYYSAGALIYAAEHGLPIVNDVPMLGMPQFDAADYKNNTSALASILAVQCIQMVLPQVPVLDVTELLDFRDEMKPHVQAFRGALVSAAKSLNAQILAGIGGDEIGRAARFVIETEIQPLLIELRQFAEAPKRPWHKRILSIGRPLSAALSPEFWTLSPGAQLASVAKGYATQVIAHETGVKQRDQIVRRSPLFYLLRVEDLRRARGGV
jgi:hypothetical protein